MYGVVHIVVVYADCSVMCGVDVIVYVVYVVLLLLFLLLVLLVI